MMERFNFYDIYGYFLPGLFWLALMCLPFLLISGVPSSLTAEITVGGLVLGYLAGLFVQSMARDFLSSKLSDTVGEPRYPSDLLLDEQDNSLSASVKWQVADLVGQRFGIDVGGSVDPSLGSRERRRNDAFLLCRTALAQGKVGSYAEQYQGMYSLMRGLAASCVLASGFYLGWVLALAFPLSGSSREDFLGGLIVLILVVLGTGLVPRWRTAWKRVQHGMEFWLFGAGIWLAPRWKGVPQSIEFWLFGATLAILGFLAGGWYQIAAPQVYLLVAVILLLLVSCRRFAVASKFFMKSFAESVYRDFLALSTATEGKKE